jgi:SAM-dependent methyltransferase
MGLTSAVRRLLDRTSRCFGYRLVPQSLLDLYQIDDGAGVAPASLKIGPTRESAAYLRRDNPRLEELRALFADLDPALKSPLLWTEEYASQTDLVNFRGHSAWVWQRGNPGLHERAYLLAAYYVLAHDRLGLMERLTEDGAFGAIAYEIAGRQISRDLLDSILEIDFLNRHLNIVSRPPHSVLDIGAGYGRLAHHMLTAIPSLENYLCADAIPESSFVCEYYLRFRGLEGRFKMVPATEIDAALELAHADLAINIHSFSECSLDAVEWWMGRLTAHAVKHFMIVPNACGHDGQILLNNAGQDMLPLIERSGYRLVVKEPKYSDPEVQKIALNPTWFWLFQRSEDEGIDADDHRAQVAMHQREGASRL